MCVEDAPLHTHANIYPAVNHGGAPGTALRGEGSWQTGIPFKSTLSLLGASETTPSLGEMQRPRPRVRNSRSTAASGRLHPSAPLRSLRDEDSQRRTGQSTCVRGRAALTCRLPAASRRRLAAASPRRRHPADGRRQAQAPDGAPGRPHASGAAPGQRGRRRTARLRHPPAAACCCRSPLRSAAALPGEGESAQRGEEDEKTPRLWCPQGGGTGRIIVKRRKKKKVVGAGKKVQGAARSRAPSGGGTPTCASPAAGRAPRIEGGRERASVRRSRRCRPPAAAALLRLLGAERARSGAAAMSPPAGPDRPPRPAPPPPPRGAAPDPRRSPPGPAAARGGGRCRAGLRPPSPRGGAAPASHRREMKVGALLPWWILSGTVRRGGHPCVPFWPRNRRRFLERGGGKGDPWAGDSCVLAALRLSLGLDQQMIHAPFPLHGCHSVPRSEATRFEHPDFTPPHPYSLWYIDGNDQRLHTSLRVLLCQLN